MFKLSDVPVAESELLQKGYNAKDLLGSTFVVNSVAEQEGDMGPYITCEITGEGLDEGRNFTTGAHNIVARLLEAKKGGKLPIQVTVVKLSGNAFDIS